MKGALDFWAFFGRMMGAVALMLVILFTPPAIVWALTNEAASCVVFIVWGVVVLIAYITIATWDSGDDSGE